jgi:hypothetical protein
MNKYFGSDLEPDPELLEGKIDGSGSKTLREVGSKTKSLGSTTRHYTKQPTNLTTPSNTKS